MVILVVQVNYWDTELPLSEGWDLYFLFPYKENPSVGSPLKTVVLTYKHISPFNTSCCCQAACCLWNKSFLCAVPICKKGDCLDLPCKFCSAVTPESVPASPGPLHSTRKGSPQIWCAPWSNHSGCPGTESILKVVLETSPLSLKMLSQGSHFCCMSFYKKQDKVNVPNT